MMEGKIINDDENLRNAWINFGQHSLKGASGSRESSKDSTLSMKLSTYLLVKLYDLPNSQTSRFVLSWIN